MTFSDVTFLFRFLPLFLIIYYLTPPNYHNWPLLLGSLLFYYIGVQEHPWMLALLLFTALFTWGMGILINALARGRKIALGITLVLLFGCLLAFKYGGVFSGSSLLLPLGISFYTFQTAAYIIDVYRHRITAERSLPCYLTAVLMFPKLISGPLVSYGELAHQLRYRNYNLRNFDRGLRDFILGLGLKVLLANQIGGLWKDIQVIGFDSISAPLAWMGLIAYSLQLYFDFCGYSIMAVGLGRMLGFHLPDNFDHPYAARSMSDFWRRWHITLGRWFRDYLYIPLGGSRQGQSKHIRNLLIVWLATGIWHGSTGNFLLWGLFLFALIASEKLWIGEKLARHRLLSHLYMFFAITLSWLFFAITDLGNIGIYLGQLFTGFDFGNSATLDFIHYGKEYGLLLLTGIILAMPGPAKLWQRMRHSLFGTIILLLIFWLSIYCLSAGLNDPFMYFSF